MFSRTTKKSSASSHRKDDSGYKPDFKITNKINHDVEFESIFILFMSHSISVNVNLIDVGIMMKNSIDFMYNEVRSEIKVCTVRPL